MSEQAANGYEGWAILEIMGRRRLIGRISEATIAGAAFIRIDIPDEKGGESTQFYSGSAIYAITPTTEETARRAVALNSVAPISRWELPAPRVPEQVADAATGWGQEDSGPDVREYEYGPGEEG